MKIQIKEYEEHCDCGALGCGSWTVSKFIVGDKTYQYSGRDTGTYENLIEFLREILDIEIEYEAVTKEEFESE